MPPQSMEYSRALQFLFVSVVSSHIVLGNYMERTTRFELATLALARRCSTTEPRPHTYLFKIKHIEWGDQWELNPRVPEPQSGALTTSPWPPKYLMAGVAGIEPTLTVLETAVLPLNYTPIMVEGVGFEPTKLPQRIYSPPHLTTLVPLHELMTKTYSL